MLRIPGVETSGKKVQASCGRDIFGHRACSKDGYGSACPSPAYRLDAYPDSLFLFLILAEPTGKNGFHPLFPDTIPHSVHELQFLALNCLCNREREKGADAGLAPFLFLSKFRRF
jgi:hypothetical protein